MYVNGTLCRLIFVFHSGSHGVLRSWVSLLANRGATQECLNCVGLYGACGACSFWECIAWFRKTKILDYLEKVLTLEVLITAAFPTKGRMHLQHMVLFFYTQASFSMLGSWLQLTKHIHMPGAGLLVPDVGFLVTKKPADKFLVY